MSNYRPYTSSSSSTNKRIINQRTSSTYHNETLTSSILSTTPTPTPPSSSFTKSNQIPFRSGFQPKGVYRDRTEELISSRNSKQESKRLEEARLQKRLEKLIQLHFPNHQTQQQQQPSIINLSQKLFGIISSSSSPSTSNTNHHLTELTGIDIHRTIRAKEQNIVRWQDDREVKQCKFCQTTFGLRIRKHHCRLCGSVVCFSPPSITTTTSSSTIQRERCSTMIRVEWENVVTEGLNRPTEKTSHPRIIQFSEHEMGILNHPPSVLDLISSPSHPHLRPTATNTTTTTTASKPPKGVRVCAHCLAIILRRQAITCPPKVPDYIHLYNSLKRVQHDIQRAIPEFQEALSSSKLPSSNLNPSSSANGLPLKLLTIRRKLLTNLSLFDSHSKRLLAQVGESRGAGRGNAAEARLVGAITTRAGLFLRDHMSLIRSLGLLETHPTPQPKLASSSSSRPTRPSSAILPSPASSASRPPSTLHIKHLSFDSDSLTHSSLNDHSSHHSLVKLNVLLEQENQLENFLLVARSKRQLDDVASLQASLDDLRQEISNLKKSIL